MEEVNKKNGQIEFLRFCFSIGILLFHICKYICGEPSRDTLRLYLFPNGSLGVEFFFLVSGYLMARTAYKRMSANGGGSNVLNDSLAFTKGKIKGIFWEHSIAFILTFVSYILVKNITGFSIIETFAGSIPSYFLLQTAGISLVVPNHIEWYLSCLLLAGAILYPFCRKYYYTFTRYAAPLFSILILGWMIKTTGKLTGVSTWHGIAYHSFLRGLAELMLGAFAFELTRYLSKRKYSRAGRAALTALEWTCLILVLLYMVFTFAEKYQIIVLMLIFAVVVLSFSRIPYGTKIFDNNFSYHLGKISMPVYLSQLAAINLTKRFFAAETTKVQCICSFILTFLIAYLVFFAARGIRKGIETHKKQHLCPFSG